MWVDAQQIWLNTLATLALAGALCCASAFAGDDLPVTIEEEQYRPARAGDMNSDAQGERKNTGPQPEEAEESDSTLPTAESVKLSDVVPTGQDAASLAPPATQNTAQEVIVEAHTPGEQAPSGATPATEAAPPPATPDADSNALVLLGTQVKPGTATRLSWQPSETFSGIAAPTPVLVVHGAKPGPKLCLTAAVHGDELNGVEIVRRIMYELEPDKLTGTVIGVPIVNLPGFRRASRYLPDRRDLNRYFPGIAEGSSASRIAHSFFQDVVLHCDMLVDLHTGSFKRTNLPQLRADLAVPAVGELVEQMGAIVVLHSTGANGSLRRAAVEHGIPAVTVEAGEPHSIQPDAVNEGVKSVEALLHKRGMYPQRSLWARQTEPVFYKSRWVRAPKGGILVSNILLGERVKKNDPLGTITDPITNQRVEIKSPISGRVIGMAVNQVMLPGYAAYHIGYQATLEEASENDAGPDEAAGNVPEDSPLSKVKDEKATAEAE